MQTSSPSEKEDLMPFNWFLMIQIIKAVLEILGKLPAESDHTAISQNLAQLIAMMPQMSRCPEDQTA